MIATVLLWTLLSLAPAQDPQARPEPEPESEEIVVRGTRPGSRECRVEFEDRELSERDLDARAKQWAQGTRVRVRAAADADIRCLSKIAFRLADKGVTLIEFVDDSGKPGRFPPSAAAAHPGTSAGTSAAASLQPDIGDRERRFAGRRAAKLVLDGKCAEARQLMLEAGDLAGAADVVTVCRGQ
ncbi:MAG: hypothetical protein WDN24_01070 [Sphingomonas sp.]